MSEPTIISFEGLLGALGRWVRRGLLVHLPNKKIERLWLSSPVVVDEPCIIIGHSFGVKAAVESARKSPNCKLLLLLDPRMPPFGTGGVVAPYGVRTVCFYQTGFMRGYPVKGAENIELRGVSHVEVPAQSRFLSLFKL